MPFLENLILGRPGSHRRRRYAQDGNLIGTGGDDTGLGGFGALSLLRSQRRAETALTRGELPQGLLNGERKSCGNLLCGNVWTLPWKSREHPIFEGQWACSSRCLSAMVRAALAREIGDGMYDEGPEPHHHRVPLGLVMLAQGWITHPQLQKALEAQKRHGSGRIGEWLVSECGMKQERIARGLGVQWNCPVLSTESFWPEAMALTLPRLFLEEFDVVPLRLAGRKILYIGFQDCLDASVSFALEQMTGLRTESGLLPEAEFGEARETLLRCEFPDCTVSAVNDRDGLARAIAETVEHRKPETSRLVRLHGYYWLRVWARGQGSRPMGGLPATIAGVYDYLFTIGSRLTRSLEKGGTKRRLIAEPESEAVAEQAARGSTDPVEASSDEGSAAGQAAGLADQAGTTQGASEVEAGLTGSRYADESEPERHYLAKVDVSPRRSPHLNLDESQLAPRTKVEESRRERFSIEMKTIEGEYLSPGDDSVRADRLASVLAIADSSARDLETEPFGLSRLGRWLRLRPSSADR